MGVSPDYGISGYSQPLFRNECMLNAHLPYFKVICDFLMMCKVPDKFALLRRLYIFVGRKMIRHNRNFAFIKYRIDSNFTEFLYSYR
jgi:hypothetical protein